MAKVEFHPGRRSVVCVGIRLGIPNPIGSFPIEFQATPLIGSNSHGFGGEKGPKNDFTTHHICWKKTLKFCASQVNMSMTCADYSPRRRDTGTTSNPRTKTRGIQNVTCTAL